ncbi:cytochrome P450 family 707 subfamily A polypeptide 2 [Euphorbia peplus]|nr:cytochrome P450 family 707 subfamily A polypeptide 2 [Euphorbia peplus]
MDFLLSTNESKTPLIIIISTLLTLITLVGGYLQLKSTRGKKLPAGSFGFPIIGESISFLRARKQDKVQEWLDKRVRKYGPVFKTSLFGSKAVVVTGQTGSKLIFHGGDNGISCKQPKTLVKMLGKKNLFELSGARHKLIRGAIVGFFKPESIQRFVGEMDSLVQHQLLKELDGKDSVHIVNLMKKIAMNVSWSIFFGFPEGEDKDTDVMLEDLQIILKGAKAIPVNFPGTLHYNGIKARTRMRKRLAQLVEIKKREIEQGLTDTQENILSWLVNLRDENGKPLTEEEILDNFLVLIFASHDTVATLTTLFIRHLARDDQVYNDVLQEQMKVMEAKRENHNGMVSWKEIQMMKYTWRVAQELMRFRPALPFFFRQTTRDINFEGFHTPKGRQVLFFTSSVHKAEKIFEEPNKFDPSRFENSKQSYPPYTYLAFGAGPRICPGAEFGKIETMLVIHHFVTKYEWKEIIPDEPLMPYPAMGLPVKFHLKNN